MCWMSATSRHRPSGQCGGQAVASRAFQVQQMRNGAGCWRFQFARLQALLSCLLCARRQVRPLLCLHECSHQLCSIQFPVVSSGVLTLVLFANAVCIRLSLNVHASSSESRCILRLILLSVFLCGGTRRIIT
eukprot:m.580516 g.580516  ORF g.580516 m.580516 type:complete len:132 (+) comp57928_c0_seq10:54-449(+)